MTTGTNRNKRMWMLAGVTGAAMAIAAVSVPAILTAQDQPAAAAMKRPQDDMQSMNRALRALNTSVKDATKNDASLASLATLEASSISAKGAMPPTIAAMPDADKATKLADYKKEMIKLIRQELDTEEAILSGDNAKAAELATGLGATEREGHGQFRGRRGGGGGAPPAGGAPGAGN